MEATAERSKATQQQHDLLNVHPQQKTFDYDGLVISSEFDSGNIGRCEKTDLFNV